MVYDIDLIWGLLRDAIPKALRDSLPPDTLDSLPSALPETLRKKVAQSLSSSLTELSHGEFFNGEHRTLLADSLGVDINTQEVTR